MLYILGGVSRSGKTTIARRLVVEKAIPFFCTDYLVTALQEGAPVLDVRHGQEFRLKAEKLWPVLKPLMEHQINKNRSYLIEGDGILPYYVSELICSNPHDIKACFIGFPEAKPQVKFNKEREYGMNKVNWTVSVEDKELLRKFENMIEVSKYLRTECQKYSLNYFDCSVNFEENLEKVIQYFTN